MPLLNLRDLRNPCFSALPSVPSVSFVVQSAAQKGLGSLRGGGQRAGSHDLTAR